MRIDIKKINHRLTGIVKHREIWITVVACFLFLFICLFIFLYQSGRDTEEQIFIIERGQNLQEIARDLKKAGLIKSKWYFMFYVWIDNKARELQAGQYSLSPSMSTKEIAQKIINGEVIPGWIEVTIPEGFTMKQIEQRLIEKGLVDPEQYKPYAVNIKQYGFLADRPKDTPLEGYLFPDTYYFDKKATTGDIVKQMLDNFDRKLTSDLREEIRRQGKTIFQIVTMASLLEKEVKSDEDRAIVSGIFWKRLENSYPLESCATIAYILGIDKWRYTIEDTRIESPYNTYINTGLPPTPINNPGLSAIKAAIYPKETDYNFFLTDPETGNTIFSKTFEEHNRNKAKYFK